MQIVATTDPTANIEGEQIAVSFKSGDETVTVALSLHQATRLVHSLKGEVLDMITETKTRPVPQCAQIIAFPQRRTA